MQGEIQNTLNFANRPDVLRMQKKFMPLPISELPEKPPLHKLITGTSKKNITESMRCSLCSEILDQPRKCPRDHVFCLKCVTEALQDKPRCPTCRGFLTVHNLEVDTSAKEEIEACIVVHCRFHFRHYDKGFLLDTEGCNQTMSVALEDEHSQVCEFAPVPCANAGCGLFFRKKHIEPHSKICNYRLVDCAYGCNKKIPFVDLKQHCVFDCPRLPVPCELCHEEIPREDLNKHHEADCGETVMECENKKNGCKDMFKRKDLTHHLEDECHFSLKVLRGLCKKYGV